MTKHALERLAERFPDLDAKEALIAIRAGFADGTTWKIAQGLTGKAICESWIGKHVVFSVMDGGTVLTVLQEGMDIATTEGECTLRRSVFDTGIYQVADHVYHSDPCPVPSLSSTLARSLLAQSPLHAWTASRLLNPDWEPTVKRTFDIGRAAHSLILGRGASIAVYPQDLLGKGGAVSTKAAKEWEAVTREAGLIPLKQEQADAVAAMAAKMAGVLQELGIHLDPDRSEMMAVAEIDGCLSRVMIDNAPEDPSAPLYDLKTCESAAPEACVKSVMNYGYDIQAQLYGEVWREATGWRRDFRFIFQEKTPPYEVCVVELTADDLIMAEKKTRRAREIWRNCLASNHWPGYPRGINQLALPDFFHAKWLERESVEADHKRRTGTDILDAARKWQAPPMAAE